VHTEILFSVDFSFVSIEIDTLTCAINKISVSLLFADHLHQQQF